MKTHKILFSILAAAALVASCAVPKNIKYIQDVQTDITQNINASNGITIQPQDMLNITVISALSPELSAQFNLSTRTNSVGAEISSSQARITGYVVDSEGCIDFPILGKLQVAGLNRWSLAEKIKNDILSRNLLSDAVVSVEFSNFKISVIGEVSRPGTYNINGDKMTLLEGLSLAGDLTIFGKRENVTLVREDNGQRIVYNVDLTSSDLFKSPAYYLKQNDVIIVEPNDNKKRQSTIDDAGLRLTSIGISIGSMLLTVANIVINLTK